MSRSDWSLLLTKAGTQSKQPKNPNLALLGDFGYSPNGGCILSDFLIFFSPWLYLHTPTSLSPKRTLIYLFLWVHTWAMQNHDF